MPIQPKPMVETETVSVRFPKTVLDPLDAYCKYLGGATDRSYVIVEAVRQVVERDKGFQKTLRTTDARPHDQIRAAEPKEKKAAPSPLKEGAA